MTIEQDEQDIIFLKVQIKDCNVMTDGQNVFNQSVFDLPHLLDLLKTTEKMF